MIFKAFELAGTIGIGCVVALFVTVTVLTMVDIIKGKKPEKKKED